MRWIAVFLLVTLGVAAVVYGGKDDSPGLQLIGVLLVVGSIGWGVWPRIRKSGSPARRGG
jgi:hypothetical protein